MGKHAHPEVSMHTHNFADYMACIYRDDWAGVAELMRSSAGKPAAAGADFAMHRDAAGRERRQLAAADAGFDDVLARAALGMTSAVKVD